MRTLGKEGFKNLMIGFFAATTVAGGYLAYDQYKLNDALDDQILELNVKLDENALETQNATEAFADIEINLAEIRESEGYLLASFNSEEFDASKTQDRILQEIASIEKLIGQNKQIIRSLESEVGVKDERLDGYKRIVSTLENRIENFRTKNDQLKAQAENLETSLKMVQVENRAITKDLAIQQMVNDAQAKALDEKERQLRTVYYAIGTFSELKESGVVEKEGGILGIASTKTVKDDFNRKRFYEIDKFHYTVIPIYAKKAELISNHDSDSYTMTYDDNGDVSWLNILNPELFWENTKYLVIAVKGIDSVEANGGQSVEDNEKSDNEMRIEDGLLPELWFSAN